MSKSNIKITLTFLFIIQIIALYVFVAEEQLFKHSVFSISNMHSKILKKQSIWLAKWILHHDLVFPDSQFYKAIFSQKKKTP